MKYLGNKDRLINFIESSLREAEVEIDNARVIDFFAGTGSVSRFFLAHGCEVTAVDNMHYSEAEMYKSFGFFQEPKFHELRSYLNGETIDDLLFYLNNLKPVKGYFFDNYAPSGKFKRKYFSDENAMKLDAIRDKVELFKPLISKEKYLYLVGITVDAADLVSNTAGTYGAFLKIWRSMALKKITLRKPTVPITTKHSKIEILCEDVLKTASMHRCDIAYLDPPYNKRQYAANFHVLENIAVNDKQNLRGISGLREYKQQASDFSKKTNALSAFSKLILTIQAKYIVLSYSTEGIMSESDIKTVLEKRGETQIYRKKYRRFKTNAWTEAETGLQELLFVCSIAEKGMK